MTENNNLNTESSEGLAIPSREEFHRKFAGIIYEDDFNCYYPCKYIAAQITKTERWNKKLIITSERNKRFKSFKAGGANGK